MAALTKPDWLGEKEWTGVPWVKDKSNPAKTMRERVDEQQQEIEHLTNQIKIIKAGDKASQPKKATAGGGGGGKKGSFSSRKVLDTDPAVELSQFRTAWDERRLPLVLGNPEKQVSDVDKLMPKAEDWKELRKGVKGASWGPPIERPIRSPTEDEVAFKERERDWQAAVDKQDAAKKSILDKVGLLREEYYTREPDGVVVTMPPPGKMRPHIVWKFPVSRGSFARDAGNLPIRVKHLDFGYYLPLFVEGLSEKEAPYDYVAVQATRDLIAVGGRDCRLFTLLPVVVSKVRVLLKSEDPVVFHRGLEVVRLLMTCDAETAEPGFENMMGVAMCTKFFKQLVPALNMGIANAKLSKAVDRVKPEAHLRFPGTGVTGIMGCLQIMEKHGGPGAFLKIKPLMPDYSSCVGS